MNTIPVYILAGGKSSRFGRDKAREPIEGEPLIRRVAHMLQPMAKRITIVADQPGKYDDLGFTTIGDIEPALGPMGGLLTALDDLNADENWFVLVACDLVGLRGPWVSLLHDRVCDKAHAMAFRGENWEPLVAMYHRDIQAEVRAAIDAGRLSMRALLDSGTTVAIPLPADWPAVSQINTPGDLEAFLKGNDG